MSEKTCPTFVSNLLFLRPVLNGPPVETKHSYSFYNKLLATNQLIVRFVLLSNHYNDLHALYLWITKWKCGKSTENLPE